MKATNIQEQKILQHIINVPTLFTHEWQHDTNTERHIYSQKRACCCQTCWCMTLISTLGRQRQADLCVFKVSLFYKTVPGQPRLHRETLNQENQKGYTEKQKKAKAKQNKKACCWYLDLVYLRMTSTTHSCYDAYPFMKGNDMSGFWLCPSY